MRTNLSTGVRMNDAENRCITPSMHVVERHLSIEQLSLHPKHIQYFRTRVLRSQVMFEETKRIIIGDVEGIRAHKNC